MTSLIVGTRLIGASTVDNDDVIETRVGGVDDQRLYPAEDEPYTDLRAPENPRRENMKKVLLLALLKLSKEAREEKAAAELASANDRTDSFDDQQQPLEERKRGRWQGFCFRKSRSGRIHPYICWKGSDI